MHLPKVTRTALSACLLFLAFTQGQKVNRYIIDQSPALYFLSVCYKNTYHLLNDLNWYDQEIWSKRLKFFQKKVIKRPDSRVFLGVFLQPGAGRGEGRREREEGGLQFFMNIGLF